MTMPTNATANSRAADKSILNLKGMYLQ